MATRSLLAVALLAVLGVACGGSPTPTAATSPSASPTADSATLAYVALIRGYWEGIKAADNWQGSFNEAALACLGERTASSPTDVALVDPARCRVRAIAILANQQKFLRDLNATVAPARFRDDDRVFKTNVPLAIAAVRKLIDVCAGGDKQAVVDAANVYVGIMFSSVLPAMDDVDPSTHHD